MITFINHNDLILDNNLRTLNYEQRFMFYCEDFPQLKRLKGLRDCEIIQIWDRMKAGFEMQQCIDDLATDWLNQENNLRYSYNDLSSELKSFLTEVSNHVVIPD